MKIIKILFFQIICATVFGGYLFEYSDSSCSDSQESCGREDDDRLVCCSFCCIDSGSDWAVEKCGTQYDCQNTVAIIICALLLGIGFLVFCGLNALAPYLSKNQEPEEETETYSVEICRKTPKAFINYCALKETQKTVAPIKIVNNSSISPITVLPPIRPPQQPVLDIHYEETEEIEGVTHTEGNLIPTIFLENLKQKEDPQPSMDLEDII